MTYGIRLPLRNDSSVHSTRQRHFKHSQCSMQFLASAIQKKLSYSRSLNLAVDEFQLVLRYASSFCSKNRKRGARQKRRAIKNRITNQERKTIKDKKQSRKGSRSIESDQNRIANQENESESIRERDELIKEEMLSLYR